MPRTKSHATCDCTHCLYCDMPLPKRHEHDHFPVPHVAGGRDTIPSCMNCHELKDRTPFEDWDMGAVIEGWRAMPPIGRIFMAKMLAVAYQSRQLDLFR